MTEEREEKRREEKREREIYTNPLQTYNARLLALSAHVARDGEDDADGESEEHGEGGEGGGEVGQGAGRRAGQGG